MRRRRFLELGLAAVAAPGCELLSSKQPCADAPGAVTPRKITTVDVHCHVFNASDLQVADFVRRIAAHGGSVPADVADLVAEFLAFLAMLAPDADSELATLGSLSAANAMSALSDLRRRSDDASLQAATRLLNQRPELREKVLRIAERGLRARGQDSDSGAMTALRSGKLSAAAALEILSTPGLAELWEFLKPMLRHRASNCHALFEAYACGIEPVDVFFPAMVDFDGWLGTGPTASSIHSQAMVMRRIHELLGQRIRAYLPFNPLASARSPGYFDLVTGLAGDKAFVGFKLYPQMGFAPAGNRDVPEPARPASWAKLGASLPADLDREMGRFLAWCARHRVPVLAHGNPSHGPDDNSIRLGSPAYWEKALQLIQGEPLRLCAGHFGGDYGGANSWSEMWAEKMSRFPTLYGDLSYWEGLLAANPSPAVKKLEDLIARFPHLRERLMYGTDWSMLALEPGWDRYRSAFKKYLAGVFGADMQKVMGGNALSFVSGRP